MPSHPAFAKFDLPDSPILQDQKTKDIQFAPLPLNGHRKTTKSVQTIKFASGRRPGHHVWYRKRINLLEVVTYSVYDGDHEELTTDSENTDLSDYESTAISSSSMPPSEDGGDNEGQAANAITADDVCELWARMYSDADTWATSTLQAIASASQAQAEEAATTVNTQEPTNSSSGPGPRGYVIRIPGTRPLGSTWSTAISVSSNEDSDAREPATGTALNSDAVVVTAPVASSSTRPAIKRGVTLQGGVAGPPVKKAKTGTAESKAA